MEVNINFVNKRVVVYTKTGHSFKGLCVEHDPEAGILLKENNADGTESFTFVDREWLGAVKFNGPVSYGPTTNNEN